jgi:gas vesicle protein
LVQTTSGGNAVAAKHGTTMSNERSQAIAAFLTGAAVGSLLGVLFAPASGRETRERITRTVRSGKEDLDELIDKGRAEWSKAKGKAMDTATMTKEEVSDFVRFLFEEGKDLRERLRDELAESADEVADRAKRAADRIRHSAN